MSHKTQPYEYGKKASVPATVLFVALAILLVYGAVRWMGGAVTRFLETPQTQGQQVPATVQASPAPDSSQRASEPQATPYAALVRESPETEEIQTAVPKSTTAPDLSEEESTQTMSNAAVWSGTRYASAFSEGRMDLVIALSDGNGTLSDVCVLALRGEQAALLAVPISCVLDDGRMLSEFSVTRAAAAMRLLLPVEFDRYVVLPRSLLAESIDALGLLQLSDRRLDGAGAAAYLEAAEDAPLLRAERFSHLLCALPENMSAVSLLRMLRLKTELQQEVKTNIMEEEGWQLIHALRKLDKAAITETTLPVETLTVRGKRAYRLDPVLTEQILTKLYETLKKTS